jgi:Ran-binding protein 3
VETGEEGESTLYSCRAKVFYFDRVSTTWKERGVGILKLNIPAEEDEDAGFDQGTRASTEESGTSSSRKASRKARLLMRADAVLKVVLNVPIFKGMRVGDESGNLPSGKVVNLTAVEDGKSIMLRIRVGTRHLMSCFDLTNIAIGRERRHRKGANKTDTRSIRVVMKHTIYLINAN